VYNLELQAGQQPAPSERAKPLINQDSARTFFDSEIRTRAYQIYEFSDRTDNHADEDWSQAETELMELVGGK